MFYETTPTRLVKGHLLRSAAALSLTMLATAAVAQTSSTSAGASTELAEIPVLEEIVVTATRRFESLQNVSVAVTAVTNKEIQDLNILKFDDVAAVAPGLTLTGKSGFGAAAQLRGVGYDSNSSASPSVDTYFNELPLDANYAFNSIYDVQQIEVLKGPQGTLRGRPSPGGAITLTSKRPSYTQFGGYGAVTASDRSQTNTEGAFNAPLIEDKLAVRVAGLYNDNAGTELYDVNNGRDDHAYTKSYRASLGFQPIYELNFVLTHQYLKKVSNTYTQVEGPGAGYNGPAIAGTDYKAVEEGAFGLNQVAKITSLNATWDLGGNRLTYVGGYENLAFSTRNDLDSRNAVVNYVPIQAVDSINKQVTHELRVESVGGTFIDYTAGLWYQHTYTGTLVAQPNELGGAFGNPSAPSPSGPVNSNYVLGFTGSLPTNAVNKAIFANTIFHFSTGTDLSLGVRYLKNDSERSQTLNLSSALVALPFPCAFVPGGVASPYGPGACDIPIPASTFSLPQSASDKAWVYGASVTQHFNDDVMAYLSFGHSFRPAGTTVAIQAPVSSDLIFGRNETSNSFELGTKSEWFDKRLRFNAAVFYQKFSGYIGRFYSVPYQRGSTVQSGDFTYNGDATVKGFEFELDAALTKHWTAGLAFTAAKGTYDNARVPCRDTNNDGIADSGPTPGSLGAGTDGTVLFCNSNAAISQQPRWSSTLQSEYSLPIASVEGYVRGLYSYKKRNENVRPDFVAPGYGLLNLYLGVRGKDPAWDVGVWAKNALDKQSILDRSPNDPFASTFDPGYNVVSYTDRREIGATLRYAFGGG